MRQYLVLAAGLLLAASPALADSRHFYPWLPFENFPTPVTDPAVLGLLRDASNRLGESVPDMVAITGILNDALVLEQSDHTPQPAGMFNDSSKNQQVIGQITLAVDSIAGNSAIVGIQRFVDYAIIGGPYDVCYLHTPADCVPDDPHSPLK
jgi:hypothetical protein